MTDPRPAPAAFFPDGLRAVNVGLDAFAAALAVHAVPSVTVDWRPPASGDRELGLILARLHDDPDDPIGRRVAAANAEAMRRIRQARPSLVDVRPALEAIDGFGSRTLLHSGPPLDWPNMCGPVQGAIVGAILFEGWADSPEEARGLADAGVLEFRPCHDLGVVGPMAGIVSPSMPVFVVENVEAGNRAFATINEGLGKVLRFGAYDQAVLERLHWFRSTLGPALSAAVRAAGGVDLKAIVAQALQMGDECHNRNIAATSLLTRALAPWLARTSPPDVAAGALDFLAGNDHFFLNLSMAACKATLDAAHCLDASTVVTAMTRNGVEFGIRLSGTGDRWFTAPVGVAEGLYFPGFGPADANPDLGDSAITESCGLGGFAMAAAPAIVRFVGGSPADALATTRRMYAITLGRNPDYALPSLDFAGAPLAIDARRVVETGIAPVINTGIAHRRAGVGQIGAGITRAPLECFAAAIRALAGDLGLEVRA